MNATAAAAAAAVTRFVERITPVPEVHEVQPFPPFNNENQRNIHNSYDELPCEQCAVPDDLRRAPPADYHCHICHLTGQGWRGFGEYGIDDLDTYQTSDGHSICMHEVCAGVWMLKCQLDETDEDVKSAVSQKWKIDAASSEIYQALIQRMLCYNLTLTRQIVMPDNSWRWYDIKLKKGHFATKSAGKR